MTDDVRRCLVLSAHPDDIEFGAAGTIAQHVRDGWQVTYVIATAGEKGSHSIEDDPSEYATLRRAEAVEAARIVGVSDVRFLGFVDGEVTNDHALLKAIAREFRAVRPHRQFSMVPDLLPRDGFVNHPDHREMGVASLDVTLTAGTTAGWFPELVRDEGLEPWRGLEEIWLMGPGQSQHVVDITDMLDLKIDALHAHVTQMRGADIGPRIRTWTATTGAPSGFAHAEAFRRIVLH